jgi:hypothetical protein
MKKKLQIRNVILACGCLFLFVHAYSQKDSTICVKIDDIGMYAPRGENAKPPYKYPSTAIAFQYNGKSFYLPVIEDTLLPQFGINIRDTALLTLKTFKNRTGYYGEKPMVGIANVQRVRSAGVHDTLCRLISFSDTIYVTDADAHWTVERYRHACYGVSEEKLSQPVWVLHIKGDLCGKLSTLVCQRADFYDRGNRFWKPMKRLKTTGNTAVDLTLESSDCQLLFQFED